MLQYIKTSLILCMITTSTPMALLNTVPYFLNKDSSSDITNYVASKTYIPKDEVLPKVSLVKNIETDIIYLLSKLSDEDLLKLLNEQPSKNEYDLNDIIRLTDKSKTSEKHISNKEQSLKFNSNDPSDFQKVNKKGYQQITEKNKVQNPIFRLEYKKVDPFNVKHDGDAKYKAVQKIKNLLYSRPQKHTSDEEGEVDEEKKELLFDILVTQLKSLCCKRNKIKSNQDLKKMQLKSLLSELISQNDSDKSDSFQNKYLQQNMNNEYMFLIINDDIRSSDSNELVAVDPESIENNSSVLLLGPIMSPLTDTQLKLVSSAMNDKAEIKNTPMIRCEWLNEDKLYIKYHDEEWGVPQFDSFRLFEMLCLEGQQAGLSWLTILKKRNNYRRLFFNFNPYKVCQIKKEEIDDILSDSGIVRHRGKVISIINNSKSYVTMESNGVNFSDFVWSFVDNKPIINTWKSSSDIPTQTPASAALSSALKKKGFTYVGPTICYAFMQACGLVNDHILSCVSRKI